VEQDPEEILQSSLTALQAVLRKGRRLGKQAIALGIANQRSTLICWDRQNGKPLSPAISWQDRRTEPFLSRRMGPDFIAKTGLPLTPYYSATKLAWLLDRFKKKKQSIRNLLCGTVNTFLIWHLTEGKFHRTDPTNAARMLLYNLDSGDWDPALLHHFKIPREILPELFPNQSHFGEAKVDGESIPITCSIGDQQASLAGWGGSAPGRPTSTMGQADSSWSTPACTAAIFPASSPVSPGPMKKKPPIWSKEPSTESAPSSPGFAISA
jgi:glycerol kinase